MDFRDGSRPETCIGGDPRRFEPGLTAFLTDEPPDWLVCLFYPPGFPRQLAQQGLFSVTARFGCDHAEAIAQLLQDLSRYHLYVVDAALKPSWRAALESEWGISRESLYPDAAGAAETVRRALFPSSAS